jgi:RluA family pseudouridine synthase
MIVQETHLVPEGIKNVRLSAYARIAFPSIPSRKGADKVIKRGELRINGSTAGTGDWVESGQRLERIDSQRTAPKAYRRPLDVVFEDDDLAVINKPPGLEVSGNKFKTVENALAHNLTPSTRADALPWARPVHRLDYSTSGLLLVAKNAGTQVSLGRQFEERTVQKRYCAVVTGLTQPSGTIEAPLRGLAALSRFTFVESVCSLRNGHLTLVHLIPVTGRTHQLRIHMADSGHPIVGDKKYGPENQVLKGKGLFLAATRLCFQHPATKQEMTISCETPHKFASLLEREQRRWEKFNAE